MTNTCSCKWLMSFSNPPASVTVDKQPIFPLYFLGIIYADVTNVCRLLVLLSASIAHYVVLLVIVLVTRTTPVAYK